MSEEMKKIALKHLDICYCSDKGFWNFMAVNIYQTARCHSIELRTY